MTEAERQNENCLVCGEKLSYHGRAISVKCSYCGKPENEHITCPKGHYICDACHNHDPMRVVERVVFTTDSNDPFYIAELVMGFPDMPMLGCQHAYIAGGALMAALKNEMTLAIDDDDIKEVFKRISKQAHGGYCGLTGVCGIAPAIGACFSVLTGSKCGKDSEQKTTMEAVTRTMEAIKELTGPSCCKAYVRAALASAIDVLDKHCSIQLPKNDAIACQFSTQHPHGCRGEKCPYYHTLES